MSAKSSREFYVGAKDVELTAENLGYWARAALNQHDERIVADKLHMGVPLTEIANWIEAAAASNPGY